MRNRGKLTDEKRRMIKTCTQVFIHFLDGIISRGCTADLTKEEYEKCHGDKSCTLCTDDYCNKEGNGASVQVSTSLLVCSLTFLSTYIY